MKKILKLLISVVRLAVQIMLFALSIGFELVKTLFGLFRKILGATPIRRLSNEGYIEIYLNQRILYEHRVIAEFVLGRQLERREVVHHINGKRSDNRIQNLCVMDEKAHEEYHQWYSWIRNYYGHYPKRETQLKKLRNHFGAILLEDLIGIYKIRSRSIL